MGKCACIQCIVKMVLNENLVCLFCRNYLYRGNMLLKLKKKIQGEIRYIASSFYTLSSENIIITAERNK